MKPLNTSRSPRLLEFVPSVRPSFLSVMLIFVCGCLWVKNTTINERLVELESRIHCFSCVKSISIESLDKMTLSPAKDTAKDLYKNMQTHVSEGIASNSGKIDALCMIIVSHRCRSLSEINSRYYGLSLKRTLPRGLYSLRYKGTVFSQNFSSVGKGPSMPQRCTVLGRNGASGVRDMASPWEKPSSLKRHSLILRPLLRKSAVDIFRQQLKTFDPNNFTLYSLFSFQNAWPIKRKAVNT